MFAIRTVAFILLITVWYNYARAESHDLQTCETHLSKYRRFLMQAILSFEDVCDAYNSRSALSADNNLPPQLAFFGHYQPSEQKAEVWTFVKLVMGQLSDMDFANVLRDAVIERCHNKLQQQQLLQQQQQRDEKRNTVVLGKKQRFHSWGGKRSGGSAGLNNDMEQDHSDDMALTY